MNDSEFATRPTNTDAEAYNYGAQWTKPNEPRARLTPQPTVHVIDDDDSFRESTIRVLRAAGYAAAAYASAEDFLARVAPGPGCLLLDICMPGLSGLQLQQELESRNLPLPIVFLTGHGDVPMSVQAMKAGAEDFLLKPADIDSLLGAIDRALNRDASSRSEADRITELRSRYERLSPAERRIMSMVVGGMLNKQIANQIGRSERTVKAHRAQVMQKMQAASLADLVRMAEDLGIDAENTMQPAATR